MCIDIHQGGPVRNRTDDASGRKRDRIDIIGKKIPCRLTTM